MTIATVIGASLFTFKLAICCGTLSSKMRNLSFGIPERNFPLLSSTATSNSTVLTSLLKVGASAGSSFSFLLNFEGILGSSTAGSSLAGADGAGADGAGADGAGLEVAGLDVVGL